MAIVETRILVCTGDRAIARAETRIRVFTICLRKVCNYHLKRKNTYTWDV